jgi:glycosyltransferase involved in cell wall biosynthesis
MRAFAEAGHRVGLVTIRRPAAEATAGLSLELDASLDSGTAHGASLPVSLGRLEDRFRAYWGVPTSHVARLRDLAKEFSADVVVVSGLDVLPLISAVEGSLRIWYAADEWVWHHVSQVRPFDVGSWQNLRDAAIKGLYERTFSGKLDRAWVVSEPDRRALRWIGGVPHVDVLANGVDAEHYRPQPDCEEPLTAVFWGRLDFGPNIQALEWFCSRVWPRVRQARPDARFTIVGFKPTASIAALSNVPGITVKPDVNDIRPEVARHGVVVLPFVSGGGIKNKLLEAAAMGKAVLCTPRALTGLRGAVPFRTSEHADQWPEMLCGLWEAPDTRRHLGQQARAWVVREHAWTATAAAALAGINESLGRSSPS